MTQTLRLIGLLLLPTLLTLAGCDSSKTTPAASQSELEKYAAENPAPPTVEVDPNGNE